MVEPFLKYLQYEKRVSPHTLLAYQGDLAQFNDFVLEHYPDETIAHADYGIIRSWIINLVENNLEAPSVNRKIACLRTYYKFLLRQEIIQKDPMLKIRVLKAKKKLPSFVKEGDIVNLLDNVPFEPSLNGLRERLILELFYATGIRLSELINLKESQIDLRNLTIKVKGKRNKERVIPFAHSLVSIIEDYQKVRDNEVEKKDHGFLLVTNKGEPCYAGMVYQTVKKYLTLYTNTDKKSPHVLRHTYATHLLNHGAEINAVKDLLGHSSLAATQVYTHNSIEKLKKTFEQAHPKA